MSNEHRRLSHKELEELSYVAKRAKQNRTPVKVSPEELLSLLNMVPQPQVGEPDTVDASEVQICIMPEFLAEQGLNYTERLDVDAIIRQWVVEGGADKKTLARRLVARKVFTNEPVLRVSPETIDRIVAEVVRVFG